jgi:Cu+-exporting ATPase
MAMGTGTAAMNNAQLALVKGNLRGIATARALSVATVANLKQNLGFAFIYNALGMPLATGVLVPFTGWLMSPMIAALAMTLIQRRYQQCTAPAPAPARCETATGLNSRVDR